MTTLRQLAESDEFTYRLTQSSHSSAPVVVIAYTGEDSRVLDRMSEFETTLELIHHHETDDYPDIDRDVVARIDNVMFNRKMRDIWVISNPDDPLTLPAVKALWRQFLSLAESITTKLTDFEFTQPQPGHWRVEIANPRDDGRCRPVLDNMIDLWFNYGEANGDELAEHFEELLTRVRDIYKWRDGPRGVTAVAIESSRDDPITLAAVKAIVKGCLV